MPVVMAELVSCVLARNWPPWMREQSFAPTGHGSTHGNQPLFTCDNTGVLWC